MYSHALYTAQRQYPARLGGKLLPPPWQSTATIQLYCGFVIPRSQAGRKLRSHALPLLGWLRHHIVVAASSSSSGDAGASGHGVVPEVGGLVFCGDRQLQGLGGKVYRDYRGDVGGRELVVGHEPSFPQAGLEVSVEIGNAPPAAIDQGWDLLIVVGTCYSAVFQTDGLVAHSLHRRGEAFELHPPLPHLDDRLLFRGCA